MRYERSPHKGEVDRFEPFLACHNTSRWIYMNPPDIQNRNTSTLDMARYNGYKSAREGRERTRCIYVEANHKQAWLEGYDQYVSEHKEK
jgi:ribosome modulation factor